MNETVFFDQGGVKVTNARFVTYGKTQTLSGITAVSTLVRKPKRSGPVILTIAGILLASATNYYSLIATVLGVIWWMFQKKVFIVHLESSSGSRNALESTDEDFIDQVVAALNDSIVHRG